VSSDAVSELTLWVSQRPLPKSGGTRARQGLALGIVDQAQVLSAQAMMLVRAATMESSGHDGRLRDRSDRCRRDHLNRVSIASLYTRPRVVDGSESRTVEVRRLAAEDSTTAARITEVTACRHR
jgi:hypothetical protein